MPDVDSTLRKIAQWKYIAISDLTKSFYQIPLSNDSMKYCGVVTPFRGVRVYVRSAMGMPGSEVALEELTCRVLGDLVQEGIVAKVADDLYCGGSTPEELLRNLDRVLKALRRCDLNLSASKTVIAPKEATILGWVWRQGTIRASKHRISTLSSCQIPTTVAGLRSFIGAYKVLSRVVPDCLHFLAPLDDMTAGHDSKEKLLWTDELSASFRQAQLALNSHKAITLPRPDDQLWIVTDGALRRSGIGATLYINRNGTIMLAGFFSAKLRKNQNMWLPCEIEALSIAASIKHFSPYIIQASSNAAVLTDSKPCVQAFEKLCRGEFSASPRVTTFLSTASRYCVSIRHVAGQSILPSDFASRNAPECTRPSCQICTFVSTTENSVVQQISVEDILNESVRLPFTTRSAWNAIQTECSDLRRTAAHLKQGTRPSKKLTDVKDVKRYLQVASIAKDGILIVKRDIPFMPSRELIVVPRNVLEGLLTSLHIKLSHPSTHQLKSVVSRYFYALNMDKAIESVTAGCHTCASLLKAPHVLQPQSSSDPPAGVGYQFAADVMRRERQLILVVREYITSFTASTLIESERHDSLREGLIKLCIEMRPLDGPFSVIRSDPAPGFAALIDDQLMKQQRLVIEIGRIKNKNKNPVAERAIQELEEEILRSDPSSRSITALELALATARLNSRIRGRGLSSREMFTQRDQFSQKQLPFEDRQLILQQHDAKLINHSYSEKSKNPSGRVAIPPNTSVGDLVYLECDRNKLKGRDRHLVVARDGPWRDIRKFTGSQLRRTSYRVKDSECYVVPSNIEKPDRPSAYISSYSTESEEESDEDHQEVTNIIPQPPTLPAAHPPTLPPAHPPTLPLAHLPTLPPAHPPTLPPPPPSLPSIPSVIGNPLSESECAFNDHHPDQSEETRQSTRNRKPPRWLNDYVLDY
ncbi:hypothetical protein FSP39_001634 [Pinctada imbricata]|uniref:Integrase catalytic domain-containing protein n=1 Tax=Pinctada imbricata TaxID=66713 RepID=A0AA88YCD6_PINIB|nr:hypothetical protein FSP39_001634 [Pinctada imbricata]